MIRELNTAQLSQMLEVDRNSGGYPWREQSFRNIFKNPQWQAFGIFTNANELTGLLVMHWSPFEASVLHISVDNSLQGQGLGTKLLNHAISLCQQKKLDSLFLEVRASNEKALRLYQALGFQEIGRRKNYYPTANGKEDAIDMALYIDTE